MLKCEDPKGPGFDTTQCHNVFTEIKKPKILQIDPAILSAQNKPKELGMQAPEKLVRPVYFSPPAPPTSGGVPMKQGHLVRVLHMIHHKNQASVSETAPQTYDTHSENAHS